jgi:hypothetical protein
MIQYIISITDSEGKRRFYVGTKGSGLVMTNKRRRATPLDVSTARQTLVALRAAHKWDIHLHYA